MVPGRKGWHPQWQIIIGSHLSLCLVALWPDKSIDHNTCTTMVLQCIHWYVCCTPCKSSKYFCVRRSTRVSDHIHACKLLSPSVKQRILPGRIPGMDGPRIPPPPTQSPPPLNFILKYLTKTVKDASEGGAANWEINLVAVWPHIKRQLDFEAGVAESSPSRGLLHTAQEHCSSFMRKLAPAAAAAAAWMVAGHDASILVLLLTGLRSIQASTNKPRQKSAAIIQVNAVLLRKRGKNK